MKNPWVIVLILAVVLIGVSVWYSNSVSESNNEGVAFTPHIKGNPESAVKLVEYSDFQCPACQAMTPILEEVLSEYGDQISFEYKHFPLPMHSMAETAARAAEAAGQQGAFFEYHDLLFINQKSWSGSPNALGMFTQYAKELGLDLDKFKQHMNSSLVREKIKSEKNEGLEKGVTGTPSIFLNGTKMSFSTYEDFKAQVESALNPEVKFDLETNI
ncbi:MAG: thioredoxin domain-containing protein [Candidatus Paceibacterota bacterium]